MQPSDLLHKYKNRMLVLGMLRRSLGWLNIVCDNQHMIRVAYNVLCNEERRLDIEGN